MDGGGAGAGAGDAPQAAPGDPPLPSARANPSATSLDHVPHGPEWLPKPIDKRLDRLKKKRHLFGASKSSQYSESLCSFDTADTGRWRCEDESESEGFVERGVKVRHTDSEGLSAVLFSTPPLQITHCTGCVLGMDHAPPSEPASFCA